MAINYSLAKMSPKVGEKADGKFYARAQVNSTTSLKQFSQLIASQTTVSRADVSAVLISSVENLVMELQRGNQVEFGDLGKFRLQLTSKGADKASDFNAAINITGVHIQFIPGEDLNAMFDKLEFNPVASRVIQKAALKAEKEEAKTLDLDALKNSKKNSTDDKANSGSDSDTKGDSGTETPSQGGSSSGGSDSSTGGSQTGNGGTSLD